MSQHPEYENGELVTSAYYLNGELYEYRTKSNSFLVKETFGEHVKSLEDSLSVWEKRKNKKEYDAEYCEWHVSYFRDAIPAEKKRLEAIS